MTAQSQLNELWEQIRSSPAEQTVYPDAKKMMGFAQEMDYTSLLNYEEDVQPAGRQKVVCAAGGVVATIRFEWREHARNYFTGMFRCADAGLIRCSSVTEPKVNSSWSGLPTMLPMVALKFFRDCVAPSGNIVLAYKKTGQKDGNFLAKALSNHFTENAKWPFTHALKAFKKYSDFPTFSGLAAFASISQSGEQEEKPVAPYVLVVLPPKKLRQRNISPTKNLIDQFSSFSAGDVLYEVYAVAEPMAVTVLNHESSSCTETNLQQCPVIPPIWRIGNLVLTSSFVGSSFADKTLFFRHHLFDEDLRLRPDWRVCVDTSLGAPFYESAIEAGHVWDPLDESTVESTQAKPITDIQQEAKVSIKEDLDDQTNLLVCAQSSHIDIQSFFFVFTTISHRCGSTCTWDWMHASKVGSRWMF